MEAESSRISSEEVILLWSRWCWGVFGCVAVADGETDKSQKYTRLSVCIRSQVFGTSCVQSSSVPCTNPEGVNCKLKCCCCMLFKQLHVSLEFSGQC